MDRMREYDKKTKTRSRDGKPYINPENFEQLEEHHKRYLKKVIPDDIILQMKHDAKQDALLSISEK